MNDTMITRDFFVRYTSPEGRSHVAMHRVWDADRFIAARKRDAERMNAKAREDDRDAPAHADAVGITLEQFRKEGGRE